MSASNKLHELINKILLQSNRNVVIVSGIHGDEPAGNIAAELFRGTPGVKVISGINNTGHRKLNGKDINRHFDTPDQGELQGLLLEEILKLSPKLVISLHEDNESDGIYAYTSPVLEETVKEIISSLGVNSPEQIHGDHTNEGVITKGRQPFIGTLEKALTRRGIPYCTIETPTGWELQTRTQLMRKVITDILSLIK